MLSGLNNNKPKIIVLTPVKNEAWILDRFLQVSSLFADHIIIADQKSTDGSENIYLKYSKVIVVKNDNNSFNESERQLILINQAREKFGINNILLALDADEILAANALKTKDWNKMLSAKPGTILYFEKPTLYKDISTVIRYNGEGWPLGYVDDGAPHTPTAIHSTRVPTPDYACKLHLNEIKFLHYNLLRLDAQASKYRMYTMLENIKKTTTLRLRRRAYSSKIDFTNEGDIHEKINLDWLQNWRQLGIDMETIKRTKYYWYDYEVLKLFNNYGTYRFAFEDIWEFDWEAFRLKAIEEGYIFIPNSPITRPLPTFSRAVTMCIDYIDNMLLKIKIRRFR